MADEAQVGPSQNPVQPAPTAAATPVPFREVLKVPALALALDLAIVQALHWPVLAWLMAVVMVATRIAGAEMFGRRTKPGPWAIDFAFEFASVLLVTWVFAYGFRACARARHTHGK